MKIKNVLRDGNVITVGAKRFHCAEVLLHPIFIGKGVSGFHDTSFQFIVKCDVDIRKELYANVVSSGGTTMFQGIVERMTKETDGVGSIHDEIKVVAPQERKYSVDECYRGPSSNRGCGSSTDHGEKCRGCPPGVNF